MFVSYEQDYTVNFNKIILVLRELCVLKKERR